MDKEQQKLDIFTQEGIRHISGFSNTLKRIHIRLISEGYVIKDGLIIKPASSLQLNDKDDKMML